MRSLFTAAVAAALLVPPTVSAQLSNMRADTEGTSVGIEVAKTFFNGADFDAHTSVLRARVLTPLSGRTYLSADLGLSIAGLESSSSTTLSNPEIGVVVLDESGNARAYANVVLPTAREWGDDDFATGLGLLYDIERIDRFVPELWSINGGVTPSVDVGAEDDLRFLLGGSVIIPKNDGDAELFARYGLSFARQLESLRLGATFSGYGIVTEGGLSLGDRTIHQLSLEVGRSAGSGLFVRFPLDGAFDEVDAVVGVSWVF